MIEIPTLSIRKALKCPILALIALILAFSNANWPGVGGDAPAHCAIPCRIGLPHHRSGPVVLTLRGTRVSRSRRW